jgi:hypothetical protein
VIKFGRGALEFEILGREHDKVAFLELDIMAMAIGISFLAGLSGLEVAGDAMMDLGEVLDVGVGSRIGDCNVGGEEW